MHTHAPTTAPDPRRWWVLGLLAIAQAMLVIDVTVVNVALPSIGAELGLDRAALTWVVTAYTLFFGSLPPRWPACRRLRTSPDVPDRHRTFVVASLASGLRPTGPSSGGRAAQGIGAALMSPAALSIVTTTFAGAERTRAGVWGLSGLGRCDRRGAWRAADVGTRLAMGLLRQRADRDRGRPGVARLIAPARRRTPAPGSAGAASVTTMFGALLIGLINAGDDGWIAPTTIVPLAVALGAGVASC